MRANLNTLTAYPSVLHMLFDRAGKTPMAPAMIEGDRSLDYAGLTRCIAGCAAWLRDRGVAGGRVALIAQNSLDCAVALYAVHAAGAQVVPVNPAYTERELKQILEDADPALVLFDAAREAELGLLLEGLGVPGEAIGPGKRLLDAWKDDAGVPLPASLPGPDDLATLQYTGGTTGLPKGVNITHGQIAVNVAQREAALPTGANEVVLCVMPLFHVFATSMCLYLAANCGGLLVILPRYRPDLVLEALMRHKVTRLPAGPTIISGLMSFEGFGEADLGSLRAVYSGSAALPEAVLQRWEERVGCPIYEGYGQSEAGPVLTYQYEGENRIPGSVGRPVPETEVQIVDPEDGRTVLPVGEAGEIRARGPQIMAGYRARPQETAAALRDGWLYTGDIGRLDEDGNLYISDRKKDMVITGGYNVYPREVEEVLHAHPSVSEAAVIGRPDDYRGEIVVAYLAMRPGAERDFDTLEEYCRQNLARYKVPASFVQLPSLPRTVIGKLDKPALHAMADRA